MQRSNLRVKQLAVTGMVAFLLYTSSPPPCSSAVEVDRAQNEDSSLESGRSQAQKLVRNLDGYAVLRDRFTVEEAIVGYISRMDKSLYTRLAAQKSAPLNAAWWWNPLDPEPQYDWNDFLRVFDAANLKVRAVPWLTEWRESSPGRVLELHSWGLGLASDDLDLKDRVLPAWREAGFNGKPVLEVVARKDEHSYATIYFGDRESRALIPAADQKTPTSYHWLDDINLFFHRRCRKGTGFARFVVVDSSGAWELREASHCEP